MPKILVFLQVCGLKWSPDGLQLASGGNDNKLMVWDSKTSSSIFQNSPAQVYSAHIAAVKALAWSPHQRGLLASGGGTADKYVFDIGCSYFRHIDTYPLMYNVEFCSHVELILSFNNVPILSE